MTGHHAIYIAPTGSSFIYDAAAPVVVAVVVVRMVTETMPGRTYVLT